MVNRVLLGVNVDHVANIRQARGTKYPDPSIAAHLAEIGGADGITVHLREDRRHIQEHDLFILKETISTRLNLEMALTDEMIAIAQKLKPEFVCLVPEKRAELTTEGGLDVISNLDKVKSVCDKLVASGIQVSIFIDPDNNQIEAARESSATYIELHTGSYADAIDEKQRYQELVKIEQAAEFANNIGLKVNAGHGLSYHNVHDIAKIPEIIELNIGHSVVARAVFTGFEQAVKDMKQLLNESRK